MAYGADIYGGAPYGGEADAPSPGVVVDCGIGALVLAGLAATILSATSVNCTLGSLSLAGLPAVVTNDEVVSTLVRTPYTTSDVIGTKVYQLYEIDSGALVAVGSPQTVGFWQWVEITNCWYARVDCAPNGDFGDANYVAVFTDINVSEAAAVEVYHPSTRLPTELVKYKVAPFPSSATITTPGFQLKDIDGNLVGSHVTAGILAIPGVVNGYVTELVLTPDSYHGAQFGIRWDGG